MIWIDQQVLRAHHVGICLNSALDSHVKPHDDLVLSYQFNNGSSALLLRCIGPCMFWGWPNLNVKVVHEYCCISWSPAFAHDYIPSHVIIVSNYGQDASQSILAVVSTCHRHQAGSSEPPMQRAFIPTQHIQLAIICVTGSVSTRRR